MNAKLFVIDRSRGRRHALAGLVPGSVYLALAEQLVSRRDDTTSVACRAALDGRRGVLGDVSGLALQHARELTRLTRCRVWGRVIVKCCG